MCVVHELILICVIKEAICHHTLAQAHNRTRRRRGKTSISLDKSDIEWRISKNTLKALVLTCSRYEYVRVMRIALLAYNDLVDKRFSIETSMRRRKNNSYNNDNKFGVYVNLLVSRKKIQRNNV